MKEYIFIAIIILVAVVAIYYPLFNTNSKKIVAETEENIAIQKELDEVDKKITEITTATTTTPTQDNSSSNGSTTFNLNTKLNIPLNISLQNSEDLLPKITQPIPELELFRNESVYKMKDLIDENDCYNAQFKVCNKRYGMDGYEIFTPAQEGCVYPDDTISPYEAAYSQVDKYLNLLPPATGSNTSLSTTERKSKCLDKPSVKAGLNNFGICNKSVLRTRCKNLNNQKQGIADATDGISLDNLNEGIENMKLIYTSCFPDEEPLVC